MLCFTNGADFLHSEHLARFHMLLLLVMYFVFGAFP